VDSNSLIQINFSGKFVIFKFENSVKQSVDLSSTLDLVQRKELSSLTRRWTDEV